MIRLGEFSLQLALGIAIIGFILSVIGVCTRRRRFGESARRLCHLNLVFLVVAFLGLAYAFLNDQFQLEYVANHSNRAMDTVYKFSAIWGGMEGSLLLWGVILALYSSIYAYTQWDEWRFSYLSGTMLALYLTQIFFLILLNVSSDPYAQLATVRVPSDGQGLNPLLQNPGMAIHPPLLYFGFVGLTIPFAHAIGALLSGHLGDHWLKNARIWTMIAWTILGLGIMRGGLWAYQELGWGGYWAWDPVENSSFMPWLMATAFIHSIMIQQHRGMLKVWNVFLAILAFGFTILGTFLTRSGIIASVHTFALNETLGYTFLTFLGVVVLGGIILILIRWRSLQSPHSLESILSREFMFVLNNLILVGLTFVILWGTLFPILSEYITGERQSVGPPYFNMVTVPLFLLLILTTGVGSLIGWRKASWTNLKRNFTIPLIGFAVSFPPFWYLAYQKAWALQQLPSPMQQNLAYIYCALAYSICIFTALTMIQEFVRGTISRINRFGENPVVALLKLFGANRKRYGGYLAHIGFLIVVAGITTTSAFHRERVTKLGIGKTITFAGYEVTYTGMDTFEIPLNEPDKPANATVWQANLKFLSPSGIQAYLTPQKRMYNRPEQPMTEVARDIRLRGDLYAVLSGQPDRTGDSAVFTFYWNPLISLVWFGVIFMAFGGLIALVPLPGTK